MANNVTAQALGSQAKVLSNVSTVADVKAQLGLDGNYTATVNGEPADMEDELDDYSFVSFTKSVKGGLN